MDKRTERLEDVLVHVVLVGHSHDGLQGATNDRIGTVGVVGVLPHRCRGLGRTTIKLAIIGIKLMSTERTCSAVTRRQASALEMSQASPRIGSRRVKKSHGVAPVRPLPAAKLLVSNSMQPVGGYRKEHAPGLAGECAPGDARIVLVGRRPGQLGHIFLLRDCKISGRSSVHQRGQGHEEATYADGLVQRELALVPQLKEHEIGDELGDGPHAVDRVLIRQPDHHATTTIHVSVSVARVVV